MKVGYVSIIGRPNVGKSTLLNHIVGKDISIISPKSQTTRDVIEGIYNDSTSQIIFVDTPGIHKPKTRLGQRMNKYSFTYCRGVDLVLFLVDSSKEFGEKDEYVLNKAKINAPIMIAYNKIDLTNITLINGLKDKYRHLFPNAETIEIIASEGFNLDSLIHRIKNLLPEGEPIYDVKTITNKELEFLVEEKIRQVMLKIIKQEVPHSACVICDKIDFMKGKNIFAQIIVEKESQKAIVIGKNGKNIKRIGTLSRYSIQELLGFTINLELVVKVVEDWKNSDKFLNKIGLR